MSNQPKSNQTKRPTRRLIIGGSLIALLLAGVLSNFASSSPDSYEYSLFEEHGVPEPEDALWEASPLPDYSLGEGSGESEGWDPGTTISGLIGTLATLALGYGVFLLMRRKEAGEPKKRTPASGSA